MAPRSNKKQKNPTTSKNALFDNFNFAPIRHRQAEARFDFESGKNLILSGYAGTGKTYLALALALEALANGEIKHIMIVRSAVSSRNIGFLPGTEEQKMAVYERAVKNLINKLLRRGDAYECLKAANLVSFASTSFERGVTYDKTCIIVDEFQNLTFQELDTMMTRISDSSRIIFSGDTRQSDLSQSASGFGRFVTIAERKSLQPFIAHHAFDADDIVRGEMVKRWIIASEEFDLKNPS